MPGTAPSSLALRGGLESEIETAGLKEKAEARKRLQLTGLQSAAKEPENTRGTGSRQGVVTFGAQTWKLVFNSLIAVNTNAAYQRPGNWRIQRKTRLMSTQGGGG